MELASLFLLASFSAQKSVRYDDHILSAEWLTHQVSHCIGGLVVKLAVAIHDQ
jgi:hypothetical protein